MSVVSVKMRGRCPTTVVLLHGFAGPGGVGPGGRRGWRRTLSGARAGPAAATAPPRRAAGRLRRPASPTSLALAPARFDAVRLLDGRADRAARGARGARALRAAACSSRTTAGIEDAAARAARRADDERSPASQTTATIEEFADRWAAQPLFAGTPPRRRRALARGPPAQRPARARRRAARRGHRRDGAAVGPAGRARRCRRPRGRRARREVRRARASACAAALPDARARRRAGRRATASPREAPRRRDRGRSPRWAQTPSPGAPGTVDRARARPAARVQLVGEQLERRQPARRRSSSAPRRSARAAAIPSGPSKVEAR